MKKIIVTFIFICFGFITMAQTSQKKYTIENFSKDISLLSNDLTFRRLIHYEFSKQIDGDYTILLGGGLIANHPISGTKSFISILSQTSTVEKVMGKNYREKMTQLLKNYPSLVMTMPINFEKWDIQTFSPIVAIIPDSEKEKKAIGFSSDGKQISIDTEKEPNEPLIAIGLSERIKFEEKTKKFILPDWLCCLLKLSCCKQIPSGPQEPIPSTCCDNWNNNCTRKCNITGDILTRLKSDDGVSCMEGYIKGKPEIRMYVYGDISTSTTPAIGLISSFFFSPKRSDVNNGFNPNTFILNWDPCDYGRFLKIVFIEEDATGSLSNLSIPITVEVKGVTVSANIALPIQGDDLKLLEQLVDRKLDCQTKIYGSSCLKFKLN